MNKDVFIAAIEKEPEDKLLRLAFADWLDEHDESDLAHAYRWAASRNVVFKAGERFYHYSDDESFPIVVWEHLAWTSHGASYDMEWKLYPTVESAYFALLSVIRRIQRDLEVKEVQ